MRAPSFLLATGLLVLAVLPWPERTASASCSAPQLTGRQPFVLQRGVSVTVEGRAFVDGCRDSMGCEVGAGCDDDSCAHDDAPQQPLQDLRLRLVQGGRTWVLSESDAGRGANDDLGEVTWTFALPPGVARGPARLVPDAAQPVRVRVR